MIFRKNNLILFLLIFTLYGGKLSSPAWAKSISPLKLDAERVPWTQLSFHAKNFWVDVSTHIELKRVPASKVEALLLASPKGAPVRPVTPQAFQMTINTTIDPTFRSPVNIHNRIWFNPVNAASLGRIRLRRGDDDFKKTYRFTEQGVFRHRIEPKNKKEASLAPEKWTDIKDNFYPFDPELIGCPYVSERSLLIYILSAAAISMSNDPLSLCVFGKRQLHHVQLQKKGIYPLRVNYTERTQQNDTHKEGTINAIKIAISAEPMASDLKEAENFSFLGFHKDISIYIDPASNLPLQASGIISTVGKVKLKMFEAQINR